MFVFLAPNQNGESEPNSSWETQWIYVGDVESGMDDLL